jgi:hypothetical protein
VGRQDNRLYGDNVALDREFTARRISALVRDLPGRSPLSLWAEWAPLWLGRALAYLSPPV